MTDISIDSPGLSASVAVELSEISESLPVTARFEEEDPIKIDPNDIKFDNNPDTTVKDTTKPDTDTKKDQNPVKVPVDPKLDKWLSFALAICVISLLITICSAVGGITVGVLFNSPTLLAFGLDGSLDILAGIFIVWRFAGKVSTPEEILNVQKKEDRASIGIACALIIIAIIAIAQSVYHLSHTDPPDTDPLLYIVAGVLGSLLLIVSLIKFYIAVKLKSLALHESGITNISGFFLSIGVIIANVIYVNNNSVWYLDASFAIIVGFLLGCIGGYTLIVKRAWIWWSRFFWCPEDPSKQQ